MLSKLNLDHLVKSYAVKGAKLSADNFCFNVIGTIYFETNFDNCISLYLAHATLCKNFTSFEALSMVEKAI